MTDNYNLHSIDLGALGDDSATIASGSIKAGIAHTLWKVKSAPEPGHGYGVSSNPIARSCGPFGDRSSGNILPEGPYRLYKRRWIGVFAIVS